MSPLSRHKPKVEKKNFFFNFLISGKSLVGGHLVWTLSPTSCFWFRWPLWLCTIALIKTSIARKTILLNLVMMYVSYDVWCMMYVSQIQGNWKWAVGLGVSSPSSSEDYWYFSCFIKHLMTCLRETVSLLTSRTSIF